MKLEQQFKEILRLIQKAKEKALFAVNIELINLYWNIGKYISNKVSVSEWGKGIVENLAEYLQLTEPYIKGFSAQNIWRMKQFYEIYSGNEKLSALTRELSWTNNLLIISKTNSIEEKEYYLRLAIHGKYSSRELERQIDSGQFERTRLSNQNLSAALRESHSKANQIFRDHYMLEFLALPQPFSEKDLRNSIIQNLKKFILEFGKDFYEIAEKEKLK